jgi:pimeloyl-ACP methyl ester carboxylesterase
VLAWKPIYNAVLAFFLCISLWATCPEDDLTTRYLMLHHYYSDGKAFDVSTRAILDAHHIVFIPGFFSSVVLRVGKGPLMKYLPFGDYFDEHLRWMKAQSLKITRAAIHSEDTPQHNAHRVAKIIERSQKPVILFAHSKGGIDALEMLIRYPSLRSKVAGVIAIQTPFWGTPVADYIFGKRTLRFISRATLNLLGGTELSLRSLTEAERQNYFHKHQDEIAAITANIPFLVFTSWKNPQGWRIDTPLKPIRDLLFRHGFPNDGLIPHGNMHLPGAQFIALGGIDHMVPVMYSPLLRFSRVRFLQTLLTMMAKQIRRNQI